MIVARGGNQNFQKVYAFNTFFIPKLTETGYESVKRWTKNVDIFSYDLLIVPVSMFLLINHVFMDVFGTLRS